MAIYEVGWAGENSRCAIDKAFVEADSPEEAARTYYVNCTVFTRISTFYVKKAGGSLKTYMVARVPDILNNQAYKIIKSGWFPLSWI